MKGAIHIAYVTVDGKLVLVDGKPIAVSRDVAEQEKSVSITANGKTIVQPDAGKLLSRVEVDVNVPSTTKEEQTKTVQPTTSEQIVKPDSGKTLSQVTVGAIQTEERTVTENGTVTPSDGKYFSKVLVQVPSDAKAEEEKNVTITENGETVVEPSTGKVLSKVVANVNVPQGLAIDIDTAAEMETLVVAANSGKVYQYTGEDTDVYTAGNLYLVSKRFGSNAYQLVEFEIPKTLGEKSIAANGTYIVNRLMDDVDGWNKIIVNVGSSDGIPIEVSSAATMDTLLTEENIGRMYHYTGATTESYTQGYFYLVCAMTLMDLSESTQCYFLAVSEALRTGETTITANGTYEAGGLVKAWTKVIVNVPSSGGTVSQAYSMDPDDLNPVQMVSDSPETFIAIFTTSMATDSYNYNSVSDIAFGSKEFRQYLIENGIQFDPNNETFEFPNPTNKKIFFMLAEHGESWSLIYVGDGDGGAWSNIFSPVYGDNLCVKYEGGPLVVPTVLDSGEVDTITANNAYYLYL